ncbi:hypothetical protein ACIP46_38430 [Streptomyces lavendulae]|uniref:hypothetical protein n=1 Tax=Streptomyces lavendulae TaxID=1914 RepID=UPI0038058A29
MRGGPRPGRRGPVLLDGAPLHELSERALTELRREHMGFVFQSFNLIPALTARQNVELPLRLAGRAPRAPDEITVGGGAPSLIGRQLRAATAGDTGRYRVVGVTDALWWAPRPGRCGAWCPARRCRSAWPLR